jgi:hypothetical protein
MMGCTWNNRNALRKIVTGKRARLTVTDFTMAPTARMAKE